MRFQYIFPHGTLWTKHIVHQNREEGIPLNIKMFLLKKKTLTVLACLLAAGGMLWAVNSPLVVGASATTRELPIYCVQRDQKMVSISFDAAWGDVILRQGI